MPSSFLAMLKIVFFILYSNYLRVFACSLYCTDDVGVFRENWLREQLVDSFYCIFFLCVCRHCRWLMSFSISSSLYVVVTRREDGEDGLKWDLWEINVQKFAKLESFWSFWFYIKAQLFNWNLKLNLKLLSKFFLKLEHFWELFSLFLY